MRIGMVVLHALLCIYSKIRHVINNTRWYPTLDESNRMKSAYFTTHPCTNPPPQMVAGWNLFIFLKHQFHILHFLNSTGLFTKPTGRHYTKCHRFSPDIVTNFNGSTVVAKQMAISIKLQNFSSTLTLSTTEYPQSALCFGFSCSDCCFISSFFFCFCHLAALHCLSRANPTWNYSSASRKMNHEAPYFKLNTPYSLTLIVSPLLIEHLGIVT